MKTIKFTLAILFMMLFSCDEENKKSGCFEVINPLTQIETLSDIVNNGIVAERSQCTVYAGAQIFSCTYKDEPAYYFTNYASSISTCGRIAYNCKGEEILNGAMDTWNDFLDTITDVQLLWQKNP